MAAPNAEGYAEAHADPRYMPCPHCGLATPRDGQFCAQCGWHLITGTPHPAEPMLSPRPASSSSGRRPTAKAAQRQALIDSFRTGPGGPRLAGCLVASQVLGAAALEAIISGSLVAVPR